MSQYPWYNTTEDIASQEDTRYETPGGAQEKADKAEQDAKDYTDAKLNLPELPISNGSIVERHYRTESVSERALGQKVVTRSKIGTGAVGSQELDPTLLQNYGDIAVQAEFNKRAVNVQSYGAKGDGITIDSVAIQSAIDSLSNGGGIVYFPEGVYLVNTNVNVTDNITLRGAGWANTFIKASDNASIPTNTGVVQSKDFLPDRNVWGYYQPYPTGLHMGITIEDITIDGNKEHQSTGNGLCIYGGKWSLFRVGVINTPDHGIWTECGTPTNSTQGNDLEDFLNMHEATAFQVFISGTGKYGWNFKGPNDSYIENVQIKLTGWSAFSCITGSTFFNGGLKIGTLHAYGTNMANDDPNGYCFDLLSTVMANILYIDSPSKHGFRLGSASHINRAYVLARNPNASGAYWGAVLEGAANTINALKINDVFFNITTPIDGGGIWIKFGSDRNLIKNINMFSQNSTGVVSTGVLIEGNYNKIDGTISNIVSGVGTTIASTGNDIDLIVRNCNYGFYYRNAVTSAVKENRINISTLNCTNESLNDVDYAVEDINLISTSGKPRHYGEVVFRNKTEFNWLELTPVTLTSAPTYTLSNNKAVYFTINLNQNSTFAVPTLSTNIGRAIIIRMAQDATGGRTVSFSTASGGFRTSWASPDASPGAPFQRSTITFIWDGAFWVEQSRTPWI